MTIRHRTGSYEVRFCNLEDALSNLPKKSFVISDENVLAQFRTRLDPELPVHPIKPGEASKSPENYLKAIDWLAEAGAQRDAMVIALGGGVIGDLAGFVAATYMRGVSYLQIPTTLLSQVDSSVGGKVGVDLRQGKNMLGAFFPPTEVRVSIEALESLPKRQFANGMAEVLKYGFIMDPEILQLAEAPDRLDALVKRCIECKRDVVQADELETTGRRAILNFGHSIGHALEVRSGYSDLLHGEAISVGMCVEARIGELLGLSPTGIHDQVQSTLKKHGLPARHSLLLDGKDLIELIRRDKKSSDNRLAFSLLTEIGKCVLVPDVDESIVLEALVQ